MSASSGKNRIDDLAAFGGAPARDAGDLDRGPDVERFLIHSRVFFQAKRYTNDGLLVKALERRLAALHGARHCLVYASASWAKVLALRALALPGRDEAALVGHASDDSAAWCARAGFVPRICELDEAVGGAPAAGSCFNERTALVVAMPSEGTPDRDHELVEAARGHHVPILFDHSDARFLPIAARDAAACGDVAVFSLSSTSTVNGFEGGYLTLQDDNLAHRLALLRGFGFHAVDNVVDLGLNAKLNEVHAAMALASLDDLDARGATSRAGYGAWRNALADVAGVRVVEHSNEHARTQSGVVIELLAGWALSTADTIRVLVAEGVRAMSAASGAPAEGDPRSAVTALPVDEDAEVRLLLIEEGALYEEAEIASICDVLSLVNRHGASIEERLRA